MKRIERVMAAIKIDDELLGRKSIAKLRDCIRNEVINHFCPGKLLNGETVPVACFRADDCTDCWDEEV